MLLDVIKRFYMQKQLIIAGFHRSGTSMLAQELNNAGLFLGDRLLGPHISNADGHYEDYDFFNFHEKILSSHNETWQYASEETLSIDTKYEADMHHIIDMRNKKHKEWGFKDPRIVLFLSQWQEKLDNPYTVVIYRHYEECVNSLLSRASRQVSDNASSDISFWKNPTLAYRMWLTYNQHIIRHIEKYPDTTVVVSHSSMIDGFPIVDTINEKFGFTLDTSVESAVKKELLSSQNFLSYPLDEILKKELDMTWDRLQSLSLSSSKIVAPVSTTIALHCMTELERVLVKLEVETKENGVIQNIIDQLNDIEIDIKEKFSIIQKNGSLFKAFNANDILIEAITALIAKEYSVIELYFNISELYRAEKKYYLAEFYLLKVFTVAEKVFPYFYNNLARFYLNTNQLILAENAIKKAIQGNPNNPAFYLTLSMLEEKKCHYILAIEHIDKAIDMLDDNANAEIGYRLQKINIFNISIDEEKAKVLVTALLETYPDDKRVKQRAKVILEKNTTLDIKKEEQQILSRLREDENYFTKIVSLLSSLEDEWAKSNLLSHLVEHLERFEINGENISSNIQLDSNYVKLKKMIDTGEIAIIPIGFRCFTKIKTIKALNFSQKSLVFDSGFFPPSSVASVINNPIINLKYPDNNTTHSVCIKYENYVDYTLGYGIKFKKSTYEEINSFTSSRDIKDINKYLDSTYGYYTLDLKHNFVLAHYNWHEFAHVNNSKGITNPEINIKEINNILNKRIQRMFSMCNHAKYIFFIFDEDQQYKYMMIDDYHFNLDDLTDIELAVKDTFTAKSFVTTFSEINTANKILKMLEI